MLLFRIDNNIIPGDRIASHNTGNNTPLNLARIAPHGIRVYIYIQASNRTPYKANKEGLKPFIIEYNKILFI